MASIWYGTVVEDSSYSILARITSLDAAGEEYVPGEGNCLQQADVSTITAKVFNLGSNKDNTAGTEITPAPTVTVSASILDTLRTVGWNVDAVGYNFRLDLGPTYSPGGDEWYLIEIKVTLADGGILWLLCKVKAANIQTS